MMTCKDKFGLQTKSLDRVPPDPALTVLRADSVGCLQTVQIHRA